MNAVATPWTTQYDEAIGDAVGEFLTPWDPRWLKAQLIAESDLNPTAQAPDGGQGIAQFMPGTWADVVSGMQLAADADPFDPYIAIRGAAWYLAKIRSWWPMYRTEDDRRRLVQASYNAGFGNITRARELSKAIDYAAMINYLPAVTGPANSAVTIRYVQRIENVYAQLCGV